VSRQHCFAGTAGEPLHGRLEEGVPMRAGGPPPNYFYLVSHARLAPPVPGFQGALRGVRSFSLGPLGMNER